MNLISDRKIQSILSYVAQDADRIWVKSLSITKSIDQAPI